MIKVGDKYLRNLEEQVQYLTDYHDVNQGLVQWGIRVIGQVDTVEELDDIDTTKLEYGDAVAVGTEAPFFFYIWTRASIEGNPAYWFPFGEISTVGPEGPVGERGPEGPQGVRGSLWFASTQLPNLYGAYREGDQWLHTPSGDVYTFGQNKEWKRTGDIRGPQGIQGLKGDPGVQGPAGPQGPKGETGDVGGFINIWGILTDHYQLPLPSELKNLTAAYLVGTESPYDLFIQMGETSDTAIWQDAGPFNVGTLVSSGGQYQNVWNADTKANASELAQYIKTADLNIESGVAAYSIAQKGSRTNAKGDYSAVFGEGCKTDYAHSFACGYKTEATNRAAYAEGFETHATGQAAHAEGDKCWATKYASHAEGNQCHAEGNGSHAEGFNCYATAYGTHAEGYQTHATNNGAHSEGINTIASGYGSHTSGEGTRAGYRGQYVIGAYNDNKIENLFEIGYGGEDELDDQGNVVTKKRYNIFEVKKNGTATIDGKVIATTVDVSAKLDKDTSTTDYNQVYVKSAAGGQGSINVTKQVIADAIPQRESDGSISVPATPKAGTDAASKGYVDTNYQPKLTAGEGISISNNVITATAKSSINQWIVRVFEYISGVGYFEVFFNLIVKDGLTESHTNVLTTLNNMGTTNQTYCHMATGAVGDVNTLRNKIIGVYRKTTTELGVVYDNGSNIVSQTIPLTATNTTISVYDPLA